MSIELTTAVLAIGLCAGVLSGIMGVGGGIIMVPAMVFLLGLSQHMAQGVSLLVIMPTAVVGAWTLYKKGLVNFRLAVYLAAGSIIGSLAGARLAQDIPGIQLKQIFGAFLVFSGCRILLASWKTIRLQGGTDKPSVGGK